MREYYSYKALGQKLEDMLSSNPNTGWNREEVI
jgi:hypothetical protein